ncbi:hypothetical protein TSAR_001752 [Trichomalopsis sarcophagae]|uniref:Uncharacterized protein n=1 Tax=Trichomalopsis sarcophagae TaxID=543379 RepID=A0A232EL60_9HYME|nr:hypothetical protein TSAR_001752 [Trichomalopsis sarcophagae]
MVGVIARTTYPTQRPSPIRARMNALCRYTAVSLIFGPPAPPIRYGGDYSAGVSEIEEPPTRDVDFRVAAVQRDMINAQKNRFINSQNYLEILKTAIQT